MSQVIQAQRGTHHRPSILTPEPWKQPTLVLVGSSALGSGYQLLQAAPAKPQACTPSSATIATEKHRGS
ncbi:hypothetical protein OEZ86_006624 [Tetradesmus obliquus]|nr:hypothetical protein OEZ86_006624 [Tetradesmus obliquus]